MHRRILLSSVLMAGVAACAGVTTSQVAADTNLIATGLQSVVVALQGVKGLSADVLAQVQTDIALIQTDAQAVAAATFNTPTATVQDIAALVSKVAPIILAAVPGGGQIALVVEAALALVPIILSMVKAPTPAGVNLAAPRMSPARARLVLAKGA